MRLQRNAVARVQRAYGQTWGFHSVTFFFTPNVISMELKT